MVKLAIIEPGHYFAEGSYGFSETGMRLHFECHLVVETFEDHLVIEGAGRRSGVSYPFRVQLLRDAASQTQADAKISIATIPELAGRMSLSGPTLELLGGDVAHENQISARLVPLERNRIYEVSGCLALGGKTWFPFHFRLLPTEKEIAHENVVPFAKRAS